MLQDGLMAVAVPPAGSVGIFQIACLRARDTLLHVFEHTGIFFSATESNLNINELILEMPNDGAA